MNKEVEKLVEKVAEAFYFYKYGYELKEVIPEVAAECRTLARQILSENNLAIIVERELPVRFLLITHSLQEAYEQAQRDMIKAGWKPVIPLAEELKDE